MTEIIAPLSIRPLRRGVAVGPFGYPHRHRQRSVPICAPRPRLLQGVAPRNDVERNLSAVARRLDSQR